MPTLQRLILSALLCGLAWPAGAEKADRQQPMTIEAERSSTVDLARRVVVFSGRVVLVQGTLRIQADRVEVTDVGQGHRIAIATGLPDQPVEFREKRDGLEEFVEGRAQRIDYDSREENIRLTGKAVVRRLRGTQLADLIEGETIVWNGSREFFSVMPPTAPGGGAVPGARVRAVLAPAPAASQPGAQPSLQPGAQPANIPPARR